MPIIAFRNHDQKVLWDLEIRGQLSDGQWENATPHDHWRAWCRAESIVDPSHVGRNFLAKRKTYALDTLLDVVGWRMKLLVKAARLVGAESAQLLTYLYDMEGRWKGLPTYDGEYWDAKRTEIDELLRRVRQELSYDHVHDVEAFKHELDGVVYSDDDLKRDLKDMKTIMRMAPQVMR